MILNCSGDKAANLNIAAKCRQMHAQLWLRCHSRDI